MVRFALAVIPLLALAACKTESHAFCAAHPGEDGCPTTDGPGSGMGSGAACTIDQDCSGATPACDLTMSGGTCVTCTTTNATACTLDAPRCGADDKCGLCVDDGDCPDSVCLPTGACAAAVNVLHATADSIATTACGDVNTPCSLAGALSQVTTDRSIVKLDNSGTFMVTDPNLNVSVTIDAHGATLMAMGNNHPVLSVAGGRSLTILDGTITGAAGNNGDGIACSGTSTLNVYGAVISQNAESAIDTDKCTVTVLDATIQNNSPTATPPDQAINVSDGSITIARSHIINNRGGGLISTNAQFIIVDNVFIGNGDINTSPVGGISIPTSKAGSRLDFNSILGNKVQPGGTPGVNCFGDQAFVAQNNIIWKNATQTGTAVQIGGGCTYAHSDIGQAGVSGDTNFNMDPMFVSDTDAHLTANSNTVRGKAVVTGPLDALSAKDIDGQARVAPYDLGADQYYP